MKYQNYSTNKTKTERLYDIFLTNPWKIFNKASVSELFNSLYPNNININNASPFLSKLWKQRRVIRTKHQLSNGYCYSLKNKEKLEELYYQYLLPYDFSNNELINLIEQDNFDELRKDIFLDFNKLFNLKFLRKYDKNHLIKNNVGRF